MEKCVGLGLRLNRASLPLIPTDIPDLAVNKI
jgi:hypothetical protein